VDGASITTIDRAGMRALVGASDDRYRSLDDLELALGEGPCAERFDTGAAVLVPDLTEGHGRWSVFAGEAIGRGVRAVFAVPVGADAVMVLYRGEPGMLSDQELIDTYLLASVAAEIPAQSAVGLDWPHRSVPSDHNARIYVASGVVAEHHGVHPDVAIKQLRAYAYSHGRSLHEVANEVVEGLNRLDDPLP
jgi:hypothetical protein